MKQVPTLCASLFVGAMSIANFAFAEIPNSPAPIDVDVSKWQKLKIPKCYKNGMHSVFQMFMYDRKPFHRTIYRFTIGDQLVYQHEYANYVGKNGFTSETFHVKSKMAWTRYEATEGKKAQMAVTAIKKEKLPSESTVVLCNK